MSDDKDSDDLGQRRNDKEAAETLAASTSAMAAALEPGGNELNDWVIENMPVHEFSHQAHGLSGAILGGLIGSWVDAGAGREKIKEYLARFTDLVLDRYEAMAKYLPDKPGELR